MWIPFWVFDADVVQADIQESDVSDARSPHMAFNIEVRGTDAKVAERALPAGRTTSR